MAVYTKAAVLLECENDTGCICTLCKWVNTYMTYQKQCTALLNRLIHMNSQQQSRIKRLTELGYTITYNASGCRVELRGVFVGSSNVLLEKPLQRKAAESSVKYILDWGLSEAERHHRFQQNEA